MKGSKIEDINLRERGQRQVIAAIPKDERLFMQSLNGEALTADIAEVQQICRFSDTFKKPVSLAVL